MLNIYVGGFNIKKKAGYIYLWAKFIRDFFQHLGYLFLLF